MLKVSRKSEKLMDLMIVELNGMIRYLLDAQSLLENCQMLIVKGNLAQINRMLALMLYLSPTSYQGIMVLVGELLIFSCA